MCSATRRRTWISRCRSGWRICPTMRPWSWWSLTQRYVLLSNDSSIRILRRDGQKSYASYVQIFGSIVVCPCTYAHSHRRAPQNSFSAVTGQRVHCARRWPIERAQTLKFLLSPFGKKSWNIYSWASNMFGQVVVVSHLTIEAYTHT